MRLKASLALVSYILAVFILASFGSIVQGRDLKNKGSAPSLSKVTARPDKAFFNLTTGNLWSAIANYGGVGDPSSPATGRPSAQWPAGSGNNYLYDGGILIGTILGGEPAVSTYMGSQFSDEEFLPVEGFPGEMGTVVNGQKALSQEDSYMVYDDLEDHPESSHRQLGLRVFQRGLTWSLPEFDDFIVFQFDILNTGLRGDLNDLFVSFWYDIDVSSSDDSEPHIDDLVDFDGWDGPDSDTDILDVVDPLDLDGDGDTGYDAWGIPWSRDEGHNPNFDKFKSEGDGFFDEWVVMIDPAGPVLIWQTAVTNDGAGLTYTTVPGQPAVIDGDTLRGWLFPRSLSYIYDGDNPVTSGNDYGERDALPANSGFLGGMFLTTPAAKNVLEDGSEYMGAYAHQWWNWESDPSNDQAKYEYQTGTHTASVGKRFLPNPLELGFPQFDYRFLITTGPLDIPEGQTATVIYVLVIGQGLQGLRENADNVIRAFYSGSKLSNPLSPDVDLVDEHWILPFPPATPTLAYSPLDGGMKLVWDNQAEVAIDPTLGTIDFEGYKIYRATYNPQGWTLIQAFDNLQDTPVYVTNVEGDTVNAVKVDLPDIQNIYLDTGGTTPWGDVISRPLNSIPYYYAVTAYDPFKSVEDVGKELPSVSSPLTNYKKSPTGAPIHVYPGKLAEEGDVVINLDDVKVTVVPNPYLGSAVWEVQYEDRIKFANLPPVAKILIFSLSGDLVKTINHNDGTDAEFWNLVTRNNQSVVSGVYIFVVEAPEMVMVGGDPGKMKKQIGKFTILR